MSISVSVVFFFVMVMCTDVVGSPEFELPGQVEIVSARVKKPFTYDACTKLSHHLTWYHVWRHTNFNDVWQEFLLFSINEAVMLWVYFYAMGLVLSICRDKLRLPRNRQELLWTTFLVIVHIYYAVLITFLLFCKKKKVFAALKAIMEKAEKPLSTGNYIVFQVTVKEETPCFKAFFGNFSVITVVTTGLGFVLWNIFAFIVLFIIE